VARAPGRPCGGGGTVARWFRSRPAADAARRPTPLRFSCGSRCRLRAHRASRGVRPRQEQARVRRVAGSPWVCARSSGHRRPVSHEPMALPSRTIKLRRGYTSIITPAHGPTATLGAPVGSSSTAPFFSECVAIRLPTATADHDPALPGRAAPPRDLPRHARGRGPQGLGRAFVGRARLPSVPAMRDPGPRIRSHPVRLLRA
jgi:hypothetical protein